MLRPIRKSNEIALGWYNNLRCLSNRFLNAPLKVTLNIQNSSWERLIKKEINESLINILHSDEKIDTLIKFKVSKEFHENVGRNSNIKNISIQKKSDHQSILSQNMPFFHNLLGTEEVRISSDSDQTVENYFAKKLHNRYSTGS